LRQRNHPLSHDGQPHAVSPHTRLSPSAPSNHPNTTHAPSPATSNPSSPCRPTPIMHLLTAMHAERTMVSHLTDARCRPRSQLHGMPHSSRRGRSIRRSMINSPPTTVLGYISAAGSGSDGCIVSGIQAAHHVHHITPGRLLTAACAPASATQHGRTSYRVPSAVLSCPIDARSLHVLPSFTPLATVAAPGRHGVTASRHHGHVDTPQRTWEGAVGRG
jgi:hypothetical protein